MQNITRDPCVTETKVTDHFHYNDILFTFGLNLATSLGCLVSCCFLWTPRGRDLRVLRRNLIRGTDDLCPVDKDSSGRLPGNRRTRRRRSANEPCLYIWRKWLHLDKAFLIEKCTESGMEYICFQRYLLTLQFAITLLGLLFILPIHKTGDLHPVHSFHSTTIGNVRPYSQLLWFHVLVSILVFPLSIATISKFARRIGKSRKARLESELHTVRRTLLLSGIPENMRRPQAIRNLMTNLYPTCGIQYVHINVRNKSVQHLIDEKQMLEEILSHYDDCNTMDPYLFQRGLHLHQGSLHWFKRTTTKAQEFYREKLSRVEEKLQYFASRSKDTVDSAFVSVASLENARQIVLLHQNRDLKLYHDFQVAYAPPYQDIKWNRILSGTLFGIQRFLVNLFTLAAILVLTNSDDAADWILWIVDRSRSGNVVGNFFEEHTYLKSIWVLSVTHVGRVIIWNVWSLGYWTDSAFNQGLLIRFYSFLFISLFMVPLFNFTTIGILAKDYHRVFVRKSRTSVFRWDCFFLDDNGVFFINNLITMGFLGNALNILRLTNLLAMVKSYLSSLSWPEMKVRGRNAAAGDFYFGEQTSFIMLNYTITTVLFPICPLILPVGLLYTFLKHLTDSWTLIVGMYKPTKVDTDKFYLTVSNIILFTTVLVQMNTAAFIYIRDTNSVPLHNVSITPPYLVLLTAALVILQVQTDQRWPFRIFDEEPIIPKIEDSRQYEEPIYKPPFINNHDEDVKSEFPMKIGRS